MKHILYMAAILLSFSHVLLADDLTLTYSTSSYGGFFAQSNITVAWVTDSNGNFVRTLGFWARVRAYNLTTYMAAASNDFPADARMGATRGDHTQPLVTNPWDLTNESGSFIPQGTYTFHFEMTEDEAGARRVHSATFDINGNARTVNLTTATNFNPISITYNVGPAAPVANAQTVDTSRNTPVNIVLTASDANGDSLTYNYQQASNGAVSGTAPNVTYTPDADFSGTDTFTFTAGDGTLTSAPATVTINVAAVNRAPAILSITPTDNPIAYPATSTLITATATDVDGDTLTYTWTKASGPATVTFSPNGGTGNTTTATFGTTGSYTLDLTVSDGNLTDSLTSNAISVLASTNTAPVAVNGSVAAKVNRATAITLSASDLDGDTLNYHLGNASHGTISGTAPNLTYTPETNYSGSDSFTFYVDDGTDNSNTATISITVAPNNVPVVQNGTAIAVENVATLVTVVATDADGDVLTYSVTQPTGGTVTGSGPNFTYTASSPFTTAFSDIFTVTANDGISDSAPATITVTVEGNVAPVAQATSAQATPGSTITITLSATDGNTTDVLTYSLASNPANGTAVLVGTGPQVTYTAPAGFEGTDTFTFQANDGVHDSNIAIVTVSVTRNLREEYKNENVVDCAMSDTGNTWPLSIAFLLVLMVTQRLKMREKA